MNKKRLSLLVTLGGSGLCLLLLVVVFSITSSVIAQDSTVPGLYGLDNTEVVTNSKDLPIYSLEETSPLAFRSTNQSSSYKQAQGQTRYVAEEGTDTNNDCLNKKNPCASPEHAVEEASDGDTILVAPGVYTVYIQVEGRHDLTIRAQNFTDSTVETTTLLPVIHLNHMGRHLGIWDSNAVTVEGFEITGGYANFGGAICILNSEDIRVVGNEIHNNAAPMTVYNGALYRPTGGAVFIQGSRGVTLDGNNIWQNRADHSRYGWFYGNGGGVYAYESSVSLSKNSFFENFAYEWGGGVYLSRSNARFDKNLVIDNESNYTGGGIYTEGMSDLTNMVELVNNVIRNNRGTGIASYYTTLRFTHNTIVSCGEKYCSALWLATHNRASIVNTIVVGDTSPSRFSSTGWYTFTNVLKDESWIIPDNKFLREVFVTGIITGTPTFEPDGFHLLAHSLGIDQGINAGLAVDIDSDPRPLGLGWDIGADEYRPPLSIRIYLPLVMR